jgi:hypothetical protein
VAPEEGRQHGEPAVTAAGGDLRARAPQTRGHAPPPYSYAAAGLGAVGAFLYIFLTLNNLTNDHYMYLGLAQQVLLGDLPHRDFVDPGVPLQYLLSAAAQLVERGPFAEAVLTAVMMALGVGATCLAASWLAGSVTAGIAAGAFVIVLEPRLYSFPKILVPAVAVCLALAYTRRPTTGRLWGLAAWTAIAFLLRYDLGAYTGVASALVVALRHNDMERLLAVGRLTGFVVLLLVPYFAFMQWAGGIVEGLHSTTEFAKGESDPFGVELPAFGFGTGEPSTLPLSWWDRSDAAAYLVYCSNLLPILAAALLLLAARNRADRVRAPAVAGTIVLLLMYDVIIVRHPILSRVGDAAAVMAILGAWSVVAALDLIASHDASTAWRVWRACSRTVLGAVVAIAFVSGDIAANFHDHVRGTGLGGGPVRVRERAAVVLREGRTWPWERYWPGDPESLLIDYLNACTRPEERPLLTWPAPEYYVLARRGFAGGLVWFPDSGGYRTLDDQRLIVRRLASQAVPLALIDESKRRDLEALPLVAQYVAANFQPAARLTTRHGSLITINVRRGLVPRSTYGPAAWPCTLEPEAGA